MCFVWQLGHALATRWAAILVVLGRTTSLQLTCHIEIVSAPRVREAREASTSPLSLLTDLSAILTVLHNGAHSDLASVRCPTASRPASWHRSRLSLLVRFYCCLEDEIWRLTRSPRVPSINSALTPRELRASLHCTTPPGDIMHHPSSKGTLEILVLSFICRNDTFPIEHPPITALFEIFGLTVTVRI